MLDRFLGWNVKMMKVKTLGRRQVVRQLVLVQPFRGSNPFAPVKLCPVNQLSDNCVASALRRRERSEVLTTNQFYCGCSIGHDLTPNCWARERLADRTRIGKLPEMLFRPWHKPERLRKRLKYKSRDRLKF